MERLNEKRTGGLSTRGLRIWGVLFLAAGIFGRSVLQNQFLGMATGSGEQLKLLMDSSDDAMIIATVALLLQAVETCAVPIFSFLLVEGVQHTSNFGKYAARVAGVAVLSEIPYNLAMGGKLLDLDTRNPAFALVLCLILLYFHKRYEERSARNTAVKVIVCMAAVMWSLMLRVEYGVAMVILTWVLWVFRKNSTYQGFAGATAAVVCSLTSPFFMAAPMSFLVIHGYNGEKGEENRVLNYMAYPLLLLVIGIAAKTL